jgi:hypothetical protein
MAGPGLLIVAWLARLHQNQVTKFPNILVMEGRPQEEEEEFF